MYITAVGTSGSGKSHAIRTIKQSYTNSRVFLKSTTTGQALLTRCWDDTTAAQPRQDCWVVGTYSGTKVPGQDWYITHNMEGGDYVKSSRSIEQWATWATQQGAHLAWEGLYHQSLELFHTLSASAPIHVLHMDYTEEEANARRNTRSIAKGLGGVKSKIGCGADHKDLQRKLQHLRQIPNLAIHTSRDDTILNTYNTIVGTKHTDWDTTPPTAQVFEQQQKYAYQETPLKRAVKKGTHNLEAMLERLKLSQD